MNTIFTSGLQHGGTKKNSRLNRQAINPLIRAFLFPTTPPLCDCRCTENLFH
ncbi:MAG: hypothetical protein WCK78_11730 [Paludibacter sp.]